MNRKRRVNRELASLRINQKGFKQPTNGAPHAQRSAREERALRRAQRAEGDENSGGDKRSKRQGGKQQQELVMGRVRTHKKSQKEKLLDMMDFFSSPLFVKQEILEEDDMMYREIEDIESMIRDERSREESTKREVSTDKEKIEEEVTVKEEVEEEEEEEKKVLPERIERVVEVVNNSIFGTRNGTQSVSETFPHVESRRVLTTIRPNGAITRRTIRPRGRARKTRCCGHYVV